MAVDILPTALPLEASQHFAGAFLPYLRSVLAGYSNAGPGREPNSEGIRESLERATVTRGGELSDAFGWLRGPLCAWKDSLPEAAQSTNGFAEDAKPAAPTSGAQPRKKVLMLGSGMVAPPAVAELCRRADVDVVVGPYFQRDSSELEVQRG